jgi:hypothetical protein
MNYQDFLNNQVNLYEFVFIRAMFKLKFKIWQNVELQSAELTF